MGDGLVGVESSSPRTEVLAAEAEVFSGIRLQPYPDFSWSWGSREFCRFPDKREGDDSMKALVFQTIVALILLGQCQGQALADVIVGISENTTANITIEAEGTNDRPAEITLRDGSSIKAKKIKYKSEAHKDARGSANIHMPPGGGGGSIEFNGKFLPSSYFIVSFEWELEDGSIIIDEPQVVPIGGHFSGTFDENGLDFQFVDYAPSIPILGGLAETGDWTVYSVGLPRILDLSIDSSFPELRSGGSFELESSVYCSFPNITLGGGDLPGTETNQGAFVVYWTVKPL